MAGKPEEKYQPGELKKVKKKLGQLSREETKRMTKILGGEIGIEKTEQHINERYMEILDRNRRKSEDKWINEAPAASSIWQEEKSKPQITYSYMERIKLYFLASHPDHSIKTTRQSVSAIFDIFSKQRNYVNSHVIENSNYLFFKSIKALVSSTRIISKNIQKKYIRREENPFYWIILDIICSWDIESMQDEIFILKRKPKRISLDSCLPLIKLVYTPLIRLSKLNQKNDIESAIKYAYKLSITGLNKKDLQGDRLRKSYTLALSEINNVFRIIKYRLYPLLLMSVSTKAYDYNTMFKIKGHEIINFLDLKTSDLVTSFDKKISQANNEISTEPELQENEKPKNKNVEDISIHQGTFLLDLMFPGAGWNKLAEKPDMYPYFKSILNLPNEVSLISPGDSLQKIIILLIMLKDMFYGFSNFEYGFFRKDSGKVIELQEIMQPLIKNWYLFIDELILKNFLVPLHEYCRHLESSTDFAETDYAKRIASDILWIKKKYICPNISLHLPKIMQPRTKIAIPILYKSVSELTVILERMVLEIFSRGELAIETLRNHESESQFEIENHVSRRIKSLLKKDRKKLTNGDLILYTYKIVMVLNNIMQSSGQSGDENEIFGLFRSEGSRGYKPIYSVSSDNAFFGIKDKKLKTEINPEDETGHTDLITGFFGKNQLFTYLQQYISDYKDSENMFSIIHINIQGFKTDSVTDSSEDSIDLLKSAGKAIFDSIRLLKDIPFRTGRDNIYILLPETDIKAALKVAERIYSNEHSKKNLYIGVTQYKSEMDKNQIMTILENTISKQLPAPGITYYNVDSGKYIQHSSCHQQDSAIKHDNAIQ